MRRTLVFRFVAFVGLVGLAYGGTGCQKNDLGGLSASASRGRALYSANCLACHNADPRKPGSVGPEIFGTSLEVLTSKVVAGKYPSGYTPKRQTSLMPAQPHLASDIPALHEFLNSAP